MVPAIDIGAKSIPQPRKPVQLHDRQAPMPDVSAGLTLGAVSLPSSLSLRSVRSVPFKAKSAKMTRAGIGNPLLIYKSMRAEINRLIDDGKLFELNPLNEKDNRVRTVIMSREINSLVSGSWASAEMAARCLRLRAELENFISAEEITVCWEPFEADVEQIGRLDPPHWGVWDLRSRDPKPGLRVFFRFADKDVAIFFTCSPRSLNVSWLDRLPLFDRKSREWKLAIADCLAEWKTLLPNHEPINGSHLSDYITGGTVLR